MAETVSSAELFNNAPKSKFPPFDISLPKGIVPEAMASDIVSGKTDINNYNNIVSSADLFKSDSVVSSADLFGPKTEGGVWNKAKGVGETVLSTGLGAVNWIPSGIIKAAGVVSGQTKGGAELGDFVQDKLSYQPKTEIGKKLSGYVAAPFEYISEKSKEAADWTYDKTGSPLLATAVRTAGEAIPFVAPVALTKGIKGIKGKVDTAFRPLENIIPEPGVPTSLLEEIGRDQRVSPEYNKPVPAPPKIEAGKPVPAPPGEPLPEVKAKTPPVENVQPGATSLAKPVESAKIPPVEEKPGTANIPAKETPVAEAGRYHARGLQEAIEIRKEMGSLTTYDLQSKKEWLRGQNPPASGNLTLYRATPTGEQIKPGDYVTNNLQYAKDHIINNLGGKGKITNIKATLDDIYPADGPGEFWYAPKSIENLPNPSRPPEVGGQKLSAEEAKGKQAEIPEVKAKAEQPIPEQPKPVETPANFEFKSRVYDRLQQEHPEELKGDVTYTKINLEKDAETATDLITNDKQKAYRLAMNLEESPDVTNTAVNIAMSEKALTDGNLTLYSNLVKNRSLAQTRRGQEIVSEKGSVTDNDTSRYVKELVAARLEKVGKNYFDDLKGNLAKKSNKTKAMDSIDKQVSKAQEKMSNKMIDIKEAQSIIDRLMCK